MDDATLLAASPVLGLVSRTSIIQRVLYLLSSSSSSSSSSPSSPSSPSSSSPSSPSTIILRTHAVHTLAGLAAHSRSLSHTLATTPSLIPTLLSTLLSTSLYTASSLPLAIAILDTLGVIAASSRELAHGLNESCASAGLGSVPSLLIRFLALGPESDAFLPALALYRVYLAYGLGVQVANTVIGLFHEALLGTPHPNLVSGAYAFYTSLAYAVSGSTEGWGLIAHLVRPSLQLLTESPHSPWVLRFLAAYLELLPGQAGAYNPSEAVVFATTLMERYIPPLLESLTLDTEPATLGGAARMIRTLLALHKIVAKTHEDTLVGAFFPHLSNLDHAVYDQMEVLLLLASPQFATSGSSVWETHSWDAVVGAGAALIHRFVGGDELFVQDILKHVVFAGENGKGTGRDELFQYLVRWPDIGTAMEVSAAIAAHDVSAGQSLMVSPGKTSLLPLPKTWLLLPLDDAYARVGQDGDLDSTSLSLPNADPRLNAPKVGPLDDAVAAELAAEAAEEQAMKSARKRQILAGLAMLHSSSLLSTLSSLDLLRIALKVGVVSADLATDLHTPVPAVIDAIVDIVLSRGLDVLHAVDTILPAGRSYAPLLSSFLDAYEAGSYSAHTLTRLLFLHLSPSSPASVAGRVWDRVLAAPPPFDPLDSDGPLVSALLDDQAWAVVSSQTKLGYEPHMLARIRQGITSLSTRSPLLSSIAQACITAHDAHNDTINTLQLDQ